jgi:hypothetical protein
VGHNIWNILDLGAASSPEVGQKIVETIRGQFSSQWEQLQGPVAKVDDLVGQVAWRESAM